MAEYNGNDAEIRELVKEITDCIDQRKYVIINTDYDGSLSFCILKLFNDKFELGGFCDSATQFIKSRDANIINTLCLDIYCKTKGLACIDNHIIDILIRYVREKFKNNPNIYRNVTLENYTSKYPFSTFIFLCAVFDNIGWKGFDLDTVVFHYGNKPIYLWQLILRADDTLLTSRSKFIENANDWWEWLLKISGKDGMLFKIYQKVMSFSKEEAEIEKNSISIILKSYFKLETADGFKKLCENYHTLNRTIMKAFGLEYNPPSPKKLVNNTFVKIVFEKASQKDMMRIIQNENVFSYAFVAKDKLSVSIAEKGKKWFDKIVCTKHYDFPLTEVNTKEFAMIKKY